MLVLFLDTLPGGLPQISKLNKTHTMDSPPKSRTEVLTKMSRTKMSLKRRSNPEKYKGRSLYGQSGGIGGLCSLPGRESRE